MTMTFEPFTPANGSEQRGYGGRRRAEDRDEPESWDGSPGPWGDIAERPADAAERWADAAERPADAADRWAEPAVPAQRWHEPVDRGYETRRMPGRAEWSDPGGVETSWAEPRPEAGGWSEQPRWRDELSAAYPMASPELMSQPLPEPWSEQSPRGGFRAKPVILGVVVLLLVVAGWEAYRIESMTRHNADLVSVLTAEKSRTDRLEKELAGVFDPEAVSSEVLPSVFRVRAGEFTGTAFSVGRKGGGDGSDLLTNYHVVAEVWTSGGKSVSLERGTTKITASIVKVDKGKDLALLRAGQKIAGLATAGEEVKPGQQVVVVGAPLGLDDTVTTGVISAYRPDDPDGPTIQFDAPINPGNSGGPVVNSGKQVVGLATAKAKDAEGIGLAIPIRTACATFRVC